MIRFYKDSDDESVNNLLLSFNKSFNIDSNPFYKCLVYEKKGILGVLVFEEIYDRVELDYIVVDNNCRRLGIASKLSPVPCICNESHFGFTKSMS